MRRLTSPQNLPKFPTPSEKGIHFGMIPAIPFRNSPPNLNSMTFRIIQASLLSAILLASLSFCSCSSVSGTQVKTPFSGQKYLSDARHFRAVGMGQSANLNIAKNKAELESRKALAQQVQTNLKVVSDSYAQEMVGNQAAEAIERFETLAREVTNTTLGDIRTLGEDTRQLDDQSYRVYVAIEIKKKAMFRFLKDKAKNDAKISELVRAQMVLVLDKELERLESEE